MPSPFPGMDPYLESSAEWSSFHSTFISEIARHLNGRLPPDYAARIEGQVYVIPANERYEPDVIVFQSPRPEVAKGIALLERPDLREPEQISAVSREKTVRFLQILRLKPEREVVAVIELLSPVNKRAASKGRETYLRKQQRILESDAHLLEIDLLRAGEYTLAPLREKVLEAGNYDYLVALSRSDDRTSSYIWRIQLSETLPHFTLPLRDGEETTIDLQAAFTRCYDESRYEGELDYTQPPEPPLTREQEVWANALLIEKGVRR